MSPRPDVRIVGEDQLASLTAREPDVLAVAWCGGRIARRGAIVQVEPRVRLMILAVAARPGAVVTSSELFEMIYGDHDDGGPLDAGASIRGIWMHAKLALAALGYRGECRMGGFCARPVVFDSAPPLAAGIRKSA